MSLKKILIISILTVFSLNASAVTPRSTGKYKNWESFVAETDKGKICFAQTLPTKRAPAAVKRNESKLFVQRYIQNHNFGSNKICMFFTNVTLQLFCLVEYSVLLSCKPLTN